MSRETPHSALSSHLMLFCVFSAASNTDLAAEFTSKHVFRVYVMLLPPTPLRSETRRHL